jgi:hypothetical protein
MTTLSSVALASAQSREPTREDREAPDPVILRTVRERRGLTQRELAQRLADRLADGRGQAGYQVLLCRYETGRTRTLPRAVYEALLSELAAAGWRS